MKININKTGSMIQALAIISILIVSVSLALADDQPSRPNRFSGDVALNDEPAPVGTVINASIGGELRGSVTVTTAGKYVWLGVAGSSLDEDPTINFTVGGVAADQTGILWIEGNELRPLDLTTAGTPVPPGDDPNDGVDGSPGGGSSSGGGFPPAASVDAVATGDLDGMATPPVPDDGATSDAPSTIATTTATDESGAESGTGSEEANGTFPWVMPVIIAGLIVVAIIVRMMRK